MDLATQLMRNPEIPHGKIRILFTPDEEVGRGVEQLDIQKLNADFGYTLDSGELGAIEDESFSADAMTFHISGVSAHPGYAKGKMVHAIKVVAAFVDSLPKDNWCPEATEGREGFVFRKAAGGEYWGRTSGLCGGEEARTGPAVRDVAAFQSEDEARLRMGTEWLHWRAEGDRGRRAGSLHGAGWLQWHGGGAAGARGI
jgi:hypothetical protein